MNESVVYTARFWNPQLKSQGLGLVAITIGSPRVKVFAREKRMAPDREWLNAPQPTFTELYWAKLDSYGDLIPQRIEELAAEARDAGYAGIALCCFEDLRKPGLWCHRRLLADWLQQRYGWTLPELPES
jgi:hypothetical protein